MVDTSFVTNGQVRVLPELLEISTAESQRIPSPGTQRALKAETGQTWDRLVGPDADSADRIQTLIWIKLRKEIPDLRWDECADVELHIDEGAVGLDPTRLAGSAISPPSVGSGD